MNCIDGTHSMTIQITNLLKGIDNQNYAKPLEVFNGSTLGQHFRHILDFYRCLVNGAQTGMIDYASRTRDPQIEQNASYARQAFLEIAKAVEQLDASTPIPVKADFSDKDDLKRPIVDSSLGRELMFAYDHAVHHLALIKIGLQLGLPQLQIDENLGVAPSTIKFRAGNR